MSLATHRKDDWIVPQSPKATGPWLRQTPHNPRDFLREANVYAQRSAPEARNPPQVCTVLVHASVRDLFWDLAARWKRETAFVSSVQEKVLHPSYQRIIGLGEKALPFIIEDLRDSHADWFWALEAITGFRPVSQADEGDQRRMVNAWLDWAAETGYL